LSYPKKPGKDSNGLTTTSLVVAMLALPVAALASLHRPSIGGRDAITPGIQPAWGKVQGVLARGDIKLAEVLAGIEEVSLAGWRKAVERCHLDIDYYAHQRWNTSQKLPWAMIDSGTDPGQLEVELNRALA